MSTFQVILSVSEVQLVKKLQLGYLLDLSIPPWGRPSLAGTWV